MRKHLTFIYHYSLSKIREKRIDIEERRSYLTNKKILLNKPLLTAKESNEMVTKLLISGNPFFVGRFGANELSTVRTFDFELQCKYKHIMNWLQLHAGVFPATDETGYKFTKMMLEAIPDIDLIGAWALPFETYYLRKYGSKILQTTYLTDLEPWVVPQNPWSAALKGKKVLVIHPFAETIKTQYDRREEIFPGTDILPEFELYVLKAVQTAAGENDERFATWFDALEWMYQKAMEIDFDVAIIGCGAYGFPLAAKLKKAGKQAIHLGGATQLLFGIKGKRWEESDRFSYVQKFFNDCWVYPDKTERPKQAEKVEDGCYW